MPKLSKQVLIAAYEMEIEKLNTRIDLASKDVAYAEKQLEQNPLSLMFNNLHRQAIDLEADLVGRLESVHIKLSRLQEETE